MKTKNTVSGEQLAVSSEDVKREDVMSPLHGLVKMKVRSLEIPSEAGCVPELSDLQFRALCDDIGARGIATPLHICEDGGRWIVVSGRHRLGAAASLGMDTVPCLVVPKPADMRAAMVDEALLQRDLPRMGRAALLIDRHPGLMLRVGQKGDPTGGENLKCKPFAFGNQKGSETGGEAHQQLVTIAKIAEDHGLDRNYVVAAAAARAECTEEAQWIALKEILFDEPMRPSAVLPALRGIQSGGVSKKHGLPGRAGTNYNRLATTNMTSVGNCWLHWNEIDDGIRAVALDTWKKAAEAMPRDVIAVLGEAAARWSEADRQTLARLLKERTAKA